MSSTHGPNSQQLGPIARRVVTVSLVVRDYDEALEWFTRVLRFQVQEDLVLSPEKRWLVVGPAPFPGQSSPTGASLLLARASQPEQLAAVGNQTGGRVAFFLETGDFWADYHHMMAEGVRFVEDPREEPYGTVVVFEDLYGNRWDLIGRRSPTTCG